MAQNETESNRDETESNHGETDSGFGDEISADTGSLSSEYRDSVTKFGRSYHTYHQGKYIFPNDEEEQDRLDLLHAMFCKLSEGKLHHAPLDIQGCDVLDLGTGTGIWAIQLGDLYPSASITGNDLSPIQPAWVPQNVSFLIDDIEDDWVEKESYDYIHSRCMGGAIEDWEKVFEKTYNGLKPGGWFEFVELDTCIYSEDDLLDENNAIGELFSTLAKACDKIGRPLNPSPFFKKWAREAGFEDVTEIEQRAPIGIWPKDKELKVSGAFLQRSIKNGLEAFTAVPFMEILGWPEADVEELRAQVLGALRCRSTHAMLKIRIVFGQKPCNVSSH